MFVSGSDDGTVRHYDTRDPASTTNIPGMRTGEMIGEAHHAFKAHAASKQAPLYQ